MTEQARPPPEIWLVDGYNVMHAGLLGRDRSNWWVAQRRDELLERAGRLDAACTGIWVVFDGPHPAPADTCRAEASPRVAQVFAPCADDWLVARVARDAHPSRIAVVSGDRRVRARARQRGALPVAPCAFLELCRR